MLGSGPGEIWEYVFLQPDEYWNLVRNGGTVYHVKNGVNISHQTSTLT